MINQVIGVLLFAPKVFRSIFRISTLKKLLSVTLSFIMLVSIAYTFIETVDPEPAFASGEFNCVDSDGRTYIYQSTWSSGTLTINRGVNNDAGSFSTSVIETFSSWDLGNIDEVNSLSITSDGEMFAILKRTNTTQAYLYKLNYNASGNGTTTRISSIDIGTGDNNAASNYEVTTGGTTYKYIFTSKGFFNGNQKVIRINGDGSYKVITPTITNGGNGSNKSKDFAWVSNHPSGNDFVGYDSNNNDLLGAEITAHTNHGASNEAITIDLSVINGNIGSGIGSNSGAAMSLGNGDVYFLENSTGDLWLYDQSAGSLTETNDDFSSSSNTDGAGCGIGLSGNDEWVPAFSVAQGSCSGSNKTVAVTLNNSGSDEAANYVVTYTIASSTSTLTSGTSVNGGASNTSLSVPAQANGTSVQLNWYAENSTYGLRSPSSGTTSVTISVDASSCSSDVTWSISTTVNTCWLGRANVSIAFAASGSGNTQYFDVEWSTDQSNWTSLVDGGALAAGDTDTYTTTAVNDGGTVYFHYRYGDSNPSSGSWLTTNVTNRTIDCDLMITVSTSLGSCSNGSATTTVSFVASDNGNTQYYDLQRRVDSGSWVTILDGESIAGGETNNHTATLGSGAYEWQYRIGDSNPSSGSYTSNGISGSTLTSRTVDCDVTFTISTSINSCSSGAATVSIAFAASAAGNTQYFDVQWSTDQSNWTNLVDGGGLTSGDTDTYTTSAVADGATVYFQYRYGDSNPSSGSFVNTNVTNRTIDCDYIDLSFSESFSSCSSGAKTATFAITNSSSATTHAFLLVEYSTDGGSSWTQKVANQEVEENETINLTQSVAHGQTIQWRYKTSISSGSFTGSYTERTESSTVSCPVIDSSVSQALGNCSSGAKVSTFTMSNSDSANTAAYFNVQYKIDNGSYQNASNTNVSVSANGSATLTQSVPHGSTITWQYRTSTTSGSFSGSYTAISASSEVDCPVIDTTVSDSLGSCSSGSATSTFTMNNSNSATTNAYFEVQYQVTDADGNTGAWQSKLSNQSVAKNDSETTTQSINVGEKIKWKYRTSTSSGSFSGSYTEEDLSSAVSCSIDIGASQSLGSCSGASKTSTLTMTNSNSATTTAYFNVQYKIDNGSYQTHSSGASVSVSKNGSSGLTQSVPNGSTITWQYRTSQFNGTFSGSYTAISASSTVSCTTPAASASAASCSSGSGNITMTLDNSDQGAANYFKVQYTTDSPLGSQTWSNGIGGSHVQVGADATSDVTLASSAISHGTTVYLRYQTSSSTDFSSASTTTLSSITIDCPVLSGTASASAASCSSGSAAVPITLNNSGSNIAGVFTVRYSTNGGSSYTTLTATSVAAGQTDTSSLSISAQSHTTAVIIKYSVANSSEGLSQSEATLSTITIDCEVISLTATKAADGCSNNGTGQGGVFGKTKINIDNSGSNVAVNVRLQKQTTNAVSGDVTTWAYFASGTTGGSSGTSINAGVADTQFSFDSLAHGTGIQYRYSTNDGSTWTEIGSKITMSCAGVSTAVGTCSVSSTQTTTITLNSGSQATVSVFYRVEYSTNSGSSWTELKNDEEVTANSSETYNGPVLANGETVQWRYSSRKSGTSHDSSSWVTDETDIPGVDPTLSYTANCPIQNPTTTTTTTTTTSTTTTTTTTTTTLPPTTTTTLKQEIFKPSLFVNRSCSDGGGASFGITALNVSSTVGADIRVKVWVDSKRVFFNTYKVGANNNIFITSIGGVPEDSNFKIKIVFKDELGSHRTVGRFSKLNNCDNENISTVTSTIPVITATSTSTTTTVPIEPSIDTGVTTTTVPTINLTDDEIDEELLEFDDPLTKEEGNDYFVWDDFEEDLYFTDGNYEIQYFYKEDSLKLAETGIDLDYILISGSLVLFAGLALFGSSRKKRLLSQPGNITIENIYKNSFKLKSKLEKILKEKVLIKIPLDEMNPYGVGIGRYNEKLTSLNGELEYTLVAIKNLERKYKERDESITKEKFEEVFSLISNNFDIEFTGSEPSKEIFSSEEELTSKRFFKIRTQQKQKKQTGRNSGLAFASLLIFAGLGLGVYASQQMYLTNFEQQNAQEYLESIYSGDVEAISENEQLVIQKNNPLQSDIPVFENLRDIPGLTRNNEVINYVPSVFGYLEIPSINLKQYVVSGTDEMSLQYGPGHYMQTNLPGSGGNVGIAGHRTTYGAPFSRLDLLEVGDTIFLNSGGNKYHYEIDEKLIVDANEGEYVLYNRGDDRITLTTCHPKYSARQRLVITGILFKIESGN